MNRSLGESGECWNRGKNRMRKNIYNFNERDNKIYYLILAFELTVHSHKSIFSKFIKFLYCLENE